MSPLRRSPMKTKRSKRKRTAVEAWAETRLIVADRASYHCERCGRPTVWSEGHAHHRQLRRHGDHSPANGLWLCSGWTGGCHEWVHANPAHAVEFGYIVPSTADPAVTPVLVGSRRVFLSHTYTEVTP